MMNEDTMEWMGRPGTTLTFTHAKRKKIKFIEKIFKLGESTADMTGNKTGGRRR